MDNDSRKKFDVFYRELVGGKDEENPAPKDLAKLDVPLPDQNTMYDYFFEV